MLNDSQRKFFEATVRGEKPQQAAESAGLKSPKAAGFRMRKHPSVVAALAAVGIATEGVAPRSPAAKPRTPMVEPDNEVIDELPKTDDPKVFLTAIMNDPKAGVKARLEAAKALLPFEHARVGEKGKKESKADGAKELAEGKKFGARPTPAKLQAVK